MSRFSLLGFSGSVAPLTRDPIKDTAKKLGVSERVLFLKIAERKGFSNIQEVADYRFLRWFKHGEIPTWVEETLREVYRAELQSAGSVRRSV